MPRLLRLPTPCRWSCCPLQAHLTRTTDRELLYLSAYLSKIARLDSLEGLNHKSVWIAHLPCWAALGG
jgi:hypothetical protein